MPFSSTGPSRLASRRSRSRRWPCSVARVHAVEVVREQRPVGDRAVRARVPAEVVVDPDDVERAVLRLAARARVAGDGEADRSRRVEQLRGADGALDVVALDRTRPRAQLVADRPHDDRRVVAVDEDVVLELVGGELADELLLEVPGLDRVDRDLRPEHDPVAVGELLELRMQRVVRADQRRAELLGLLDEPRTARVVDREALVGRVLVQADPAEVQGRPLSSSRPPTTLIERMPVSVSQRWATLPLPWPMRALSRRR